MVEFDIKYNKNKSILRKSHTSQPNKFDWDKFSRYVLWGGYIFAILMTAFLIPNSFFHWVNNANVSIIGAYMGMLLTILVLLNACMELGGTEKTKKLESLLSILLITVMLLFTFINLDEKDVIDRTFIAVIRSIGYVITITVAGSKIHSLIKKK